MFTLTHGPHSLNKLHSISQEQDSFLLQAYSSEQRQKYKKNKKEKNYKKTLKMTGTKLGARWKRPTHDMKYG